MHALVLVCINQHAKIGVPNLTNFIDMIGAKIKKTGYMTLTTPITSWPISADTRRTTVGNHCYLPHTICGVAY